MAITAGADDAPHLRLTLLRPAAAPADAVRAGGVALVPSPGPAPAALVDEVIGRLRSGAATVAWQQIDQTPPPPPPAPAESGATRQQVEQTLRIAGHRLDVGEPAAAREAMDAVPADLTTEAALEVAVVWRRLGDLDRVRAVIEAARPERPVEKAAAAVLLAPAGSPPGFSLEGVEPEAICGYIYVARLHRLLGDLEQAQTAAAALRAADPACVDAWELEILTLVDRRRGDEALPLAEQAVARFPDDDRSLLAAAAVYQLRGELARGVPLLERVARRHLTDRNPLRVLLGALVRDTANREGYKAELARRIEGSPDDVLARFLLGVLHHYENDFAASNALLKPLEVTLDMEDRLHIYLAMNDFNLGDAAAGLARLDRVAERPDPDPDVYYCRAELLRDTDRERARTELRRYATMSAGSVLANPDKEVRIEALLALVDACIADGRAECEGPWEHPRLRHDRGSRPLTWALAGLLLAAALAGGIWWRRRRQA